jgi:hypothetical protein
MSMNHNRRFKRSRPEPTSEEWTALFILFPPAWIMRWVWRRRPWRPMVLVLALMPTGCATTASHDAMLTGTAMAVGSFTRDQGTSHPRPLAQERFRVGESVYLRVMFTDAGVPHTVAIAVDGPRTYTHTWTTRAVPGRQDASWQFQMARPNTLTTGQYVVTLTIDSYPAGTLAFTILPAP